ncbi:MAG: DUF1127 domain-containing protein [Pseudomonadota bacterium]
MADITLLTTRPASLATRVTGWLHQLSLKRDAQRTLKELNELDDHMLRDIGLERDDVTQGLDLDTQIRSQSPRIYL